MVGCYRGGGGRGGCGGWVELRGGRCRQAGHRGLSGGRLGVGRVGVRGRSARVAVWGFSRQVVDQVYFHLGGMTIEGVLAFGVEMELKQLVFLTIDDDVIFIVFNVHLNGVPIVYQ